MTNLIEERDERTRQRKKDKKKHDQEIDLAVKADKKTLSFTHPIKNLSENRQRLLDEGAIEADGWIDCFIKRGTIEKFLNGENTYLDNIDDSYEGNVNLGHLDFATFPYIIGTWTKKDLHVVDLEDERKAVDVDIHLDEESIFVQELARMPYDIGISAEFYYHIDEDATNELMEERDEYIPVIDEILIKAYGLVGECGNVNSDGLELKGGKSMEEKMELNIELENGDEVKEEIEEAQEAIAEAQEVLDEEQEDETDESEEDEAEEKAEEEVEEEIIEEEIAEEDEDEEDEDEEDESLEELSAIIDELTNENKELKATIKHLKQNNKKLQRKLAVKSQSIDEFVEKFKGLSLNLGLKKEEEAEVKPERVYAGNDGIGE